LSSGASPPDIDGMKRSGVRTWLFVIVAGLAVAIFIRLGVWQVQRLGERRALNRARAALADLPVIDLPDSGPLPPVDSLLWRRVRLSGTWLFDSDIVIRGRATLGSPGVDLVTPVHREGGPGMLVLRGWLPAADALSADLRAARPPRGESAPPAEVLGIVLPGEPSAAVPPRLTRFENEVHLVLASLEFDAIHRDIDEPLVDAWVLPDSAVDVGGKIVPRRVELPPPSDGPHLMYAFQWFAFAAITAAGTVAFLVAGRRNGDVRRVT